MAARLPVWDGDVDLGGRSRSNWIATCNEADGARACPSKQMMPWMPNCLPR